MTIRISDPLDLVAVLPYHLGYHPERSLVLVTVGRETIGVTVRVDLDVPADEHVALSRHLCAAMSRDGAEGCFLVVFEPSPGEGEALTEALMPELDTAGIDVLEHLVVRDGRVFFPRCVDGCHPWDGVPLRSPEEVPAVAEFVGLGRAPVRDRDALHDLMAPVDTTFARRCARETRRLLAQQVASGGDAQPHAHAAAVRAWARLLSSFSGEGTNARQVAHMTASLADKDFRDALIGWLCPGCLPDSMVDPALRRRLARSLPQGPAADVIAQLCWLARHTSGSDAPGVLTVLATVSWSSGDGALARVALTRARALDPDYTLALLLERLVVHGIRLRATGGPEGLPLPGARAS